MSPVFRPDPSKVAAGVKVYDKGTYELEIGDPKPFLRETRSGKNAGQENYGVMFVCVILEGPEKGNKYIHNCMMHTPEVEAFSKQFQMAAYGYEKRDETKFNEEIAATKDWSFDPKPDDGSDPTCGNGWRDMKGKRIKIDLDKTLNNDKQEQQKVVGIRPL